MPTSVECVCCCETDAIKNKMDENETVIGCITEHEGFQPVCFDRWVLQTGFFNYRQQYGVQNIHEDPINE